jgi:histidine triad (HIT) family protein
MTAARCIFCDIVHDRIAAHRVWEDAAHLAILDVNPCQRGHVLLLPKTHHRYVFDMPEAEYLSIWSAARRLGPLLSAAVGAVRTGIAVEGFGVDHLHIHLVPVQQGGDLDPNKQRAMAPDELARVAALLRDAFARD